jgi:hypothetical protein
MEIYRVEKTDMMGFPITELFFTSLDKARTEYAKQLREYRNNENLVKDEDNNYLSNPIVENKSPFNNFIKEHMIELWYRCSYEYDEWDTTVEHLKLEKIKVY